MAEENPLSSREYEILKLVAQGKSNKEIASDLIISVNTVKVHISNIFQKLGISSRSEAIMVALEQGLLENPRQEVSEPHVIKEIVEAAPPRWLTWLQKFWFIPALAIVLIVVALSFLLSRSSLLAKPTPMPDPIQNLISQNRWQELEPLKPARTGIASVAYKNQIFAIGGESLEGVSALNQSFNTRNNRWTQNAPKPHAVKHAKAIELGGKIYVYGGELSDGKMSNQLDVYTIDSDTWESKAPAPIALSRYAAVAFNGEIYFFGGWDGMSLSNKTLLYNPATDLWQEALSSPAEFADAFAVTANDLILVIGGNQTVNNQGAESLQAITTLRIFSPLTDSDQSGSWSKPLDVFEAKKIYAAEDLGDSIVAFSEDREGNTLISFYSEFNETWIHTVETSQHTIHSDAGLANVAGAVYFIGGKDETENLSEDFARYQAVFTIAIPAISN